MTQGTKATKARRSANDRRRPGRPPQQHSDSTDVPEALLEAARQLFTDRGFHEVSTREIARAAGVNPAMIHYYFEDKEGLYRAMLQGAFARLFDELSKLAGESKDGSPITGLLGLYAGTLFRDPWIPRLLIREVLSDGAPFREQFIEQFASPASKLIPKLLRQEQRAGRLRKGLDPTLATLSLMGMTLFPFLAFPVASRVFGLKLDENFRDRFLEHTIKMFFDGAAAR